MNQIILMPCMRRNLRLAGIPQTVQMRANLVMSAAVVKKLGKQRIKS